MDEKQYLGTGIHFPVSVNPVTGRFLMSSGLKSVKESIYLILTTQKEERWIRPEFGSRILSYTFTDTSLTRLNMMARELEETILSQEPRIRSVQVKMEAQLDKGCLIVDISYQTVEKNTRDNLVFPFYLYAEKEESLDGIQE